MGTRICRWTSALPRSDSLWNDLEERDYILLNEGDEAPPSMATTFGNIDHYAAMMAMLRVGGRSRHYSRCRRDEPFTDQDGQLLTTFAVPIVLAIEDAIRTNGSWNGSPTGRDAHQLDHLAHLVESARRPLTLVRGYLELLIDGTLGSIPEAQVTTVKMLLDKTRQLEMCLMNWFRPSTCRTYRAITAVAFSLLREVLDAQTISIRLAGLNLVSELDANEDERYVVSGDAQTFLLCLKR